MGFKLGTHFPALVKQRAIDSAFVAQHSLAMAEKSTANAELRALNGSDKALNAVGVIKWQLRAAQDRDNATEMAKLATLIGV